MELSPKIYTLEECGLSLEDVIPQSTAVEGFVSGCPNYEGDWRKIGVDVPKLREMLINENKNDEPYSDSVRFLLDKIRRVANKSRTMSPIDWQYFGGIYTGLISCINDGIAKYVRSEKLVLCSSTVHSPNVGVGCMAPIVLSIAITIIGSICGCGPSEPAESEIANGMRRQFIMNTGAYPSSVKAKKIGSGRWAVRTTAERYGERRSIDATAIMDKNGDIHYYTN